MKSFQIRALFTVALVLAGAVALAACGGSDSSSDTSAMTSPTTTTAAAGGSGGGNGTVDLADNGALGTQILVDSEGRTLYLFEKDQSADASTCSGTCAQDWPPLTTNGKVTVGKGLDDSKLTTFKRDDGTTQVAYDGHPLYFYAGDSAPGDANGNGLEAYGAEWYAMDASGQTVEDGSSSSGGDSTSTDSTSGDDSTSSDSTSGGSGSDSTSGYPSY